MPRGQSPGPTLVRSNYHGPLAQAEGRLGLTHLPACPGPLPPHPPHPAEFPTSALCGVVLLIGALPPPARPPTNLSVTGRHGATGERDADANNNNNNNNSVKRCHREADLALRGPLLQQRWRRGRCSPAAAGGVTFQTLRIHTGGASAPLAGPRSPPKVLPVRPRLFAKAH